LLSARSRHNFTVDPFLNQGEKANNTQHVDI